LSTVVGIATGMFTLRDQVFPHESGTAQAADYQTSIGAICLAINEGESARARDARKLGRRLHRVHSIPAQRDALLDSTNRRIAQLVDEISKFSALTPPKGLAAEHRAIRAAWERNLERIRDYAHQLDGARGATQLAAALDVLYRYRLALSRDGLIVRKGISRLGGRHCDLDKPIVTRNVTVPGLPEAAAEDDGGGGGRGRGTAPRDGGSRGGDGDSGGSSATPPDGNGGGSATPPAGSDGDESTAPADGGAGSSPPSGSGGGSVIPPSGNGGGGGGGSEG
jgi:hypothetical protein